MTLRAQPKKKLEGTYVRSPCHYGPLMRQKACFFNLLLLPANRPRNCDFKDGWFSSSRLAAKQTLLNFRSMGA